MTSPKTALKRIKSYIGQLIRTLRKNVSSEKIWLSDGRLEDGSDYFCFEFYKSEKFISPAIQNLHKRFAIVKRGFLSNGRAIRVFNNESILTTPVLLSKEHIFKFSLSIPHGESANAEVVVVNAADQTKIATYHLSRKDHNQFQTFTIGLEHLAGEKIAFSINVQSQKNDFEIGITQLVICRKGQFSRINALSNYGWRLKNEIANFSGAAYTHSMYQSEALDKNSKDAPVIEKQHPQTHQQAIQVFISTQEQKLRKKIAGVSPGPGETVYGFSLRCLSAAIPLQAPDFFKRASDFSLHCDKPLRILSLCSGAARIEEEILKHCQAKVELTLFDASEDLLRRAAVKFNEAGQQVRCILGDLNNGLPSDDSFDIIICVSALHHIADLESVLFQINKLLSEKGEFWSIGEQIGRNGNRLWPDALNAANRAFRQLPATYRKNAHTDRIDEEILDNDFSLGSFEGIRSEELECLLENYLIPVEIYKRNCFLWRLTDVTYCDNFDLSSKEDLDKLRELVVAEALHWVCGGKGTELHAVYRRRQF